MNSRLAVLALVTVMFTGCMTDNGTPPTTPEQPAEDDPETPDDPPADAGTAWSDIPLIEHASGEAIRINASTGINLLRVHVNETNALAVTRSNTTVDHISYVYPGKGPFDPASDCDALTQPSAFEFQIGSTYHRSKFVQGTAHQGEHTVIIVAKKSFQALLFFGSGFTNDDTTGVRPLTLSGDLKTSTNSTTDEYPRDIQDTRSSEPSWFMAAGARATQKMNSTGASYAVGNDSSGTLELTLDDQAGCTDERSDQYRVEADDKGTTAVSTAVGGIRGTGETMAATIDYDAHDGSTESTVSWVFAWFELPDVRT